MAVLDGTRFTLFGALASARTSCSCCSAAASSVALCASK
jgi:hypothetical protein